jgi:hypothetical protein
MKQPTNKVQAGIPEGAAPRMALPKTTPQQFAEAYDALCREYGYMLTAQPVLKPAFDGSFTVAAQLAIVERKEQNL